MSETSEQRADDSFRFLVRYRTAAIEHGSKWLDYSLHPATKLGLHNALLAVHDRIEILEARHDDFACGVFVVRHDQIEPLTQEGAERLFATLPNGDVKWLDLWQCLLPPIPDPAALTLPAAGAPAEASAQIPLFTHTHTPYDDLDPPPAHHFDTAA